MVDFRTRRNPALLQQLIQAKSRAAAAPFQGIKEGVQLGEQLSQISQRRKQEKERLNEQMQQIANRRKKAEEMALFLKSDKGRELLETGLPPGIIDQAGAGSLFNMMQSIAKSKREGPLAEAKVEALKEKTRKSKQITDVIEFMDENGEKAAIKKFGQRRVKNALKAKESLFDQFLKFKAVTGGSNGAVPTKSKKFEIVK